MSKFSAALARKLFSRSGIIGVEGIIALAVGGVALTGIIGFLIYVGARGGGPPPVAPAPVPAPRPIAIPFSASSVAAPSPFPSLSPYAASGSMLGIPWQSAHPAASTSLIRVSWQQFPYANVTLSDHAPLSWVDGNIQYSLVGAQFTPVSLPPAPYHTNYVDNKISRQLSPGEGRIALILYLKMQTTGSAYGYPQPNIRRVLNEAGEMTAPNIQQFTFADAGGGNQMRPHQTYFYEVPFFATVEDQNFLFWTGGTSNVYFSIARAGNLLRIEREKEIFSADAAAERFTNSTSRSSTALSLTAFSTGFSQPYPVTWKEQGGQLAYSLTGIMLGNYPAERLSASYRSGDLMRAIVLSVRIDVSHVLATTDIRMVKTDGSLVVPVSPQPYLLRQGGVSGPWDFTLNSDIVFRADPSETDFTFRIPSSTVGGFSYFRVYLDGNALKLGDPRG